MSEQIIISERNDQDFNVRVMAAHHVGWTVVDGSLTVSQSRSGPPTYTVTMENTNGAPYPPNPVPEPATLALALMGTVVLLLLRRRRK